MLTFSVIIPTLNRANSLSLAVSSITKQSILPTELIIVDQSINLDSKEAIEKIFKTITTIRLIIIHDCEIDGLVAAKAVGVKNASSDLIFFLEDDVVLEDDYFLRLYECFTSFPSIQGCCGVVTNSPYSSKIRKILFQMFHLGYFHDQRHSILNKSAKELDVLVESSKLSGGTSAWRKNVFVDVFFDIEGGFHYLEDIEFSTRVYEFYRGGLYIVPTARLIHNMSPLNRRNDFDRNKAKVREYWSFYNKRSNHTIADFFCLVWLLIGLLLSALFESASVRSCDSLIGFFSGFRSQIMWFKRR